MMSPRPRTAVTATVAQLTLLCCFAGLDAQTDLTVELGASRIGPALDTEGDPARFVMAGLRGGAFTTAGSGLFASVLFGRTLDVSAGGSFLSGMLEGTLADHWTPRLRASLTARGLAHGVQEPFPYRAFAVEGGPALEYRAPNVSIALTGLAGTGRSQLELWRVEGGPSRVFENELWRAGATAEALVGPVTSRFGLVGGWHRTPSGAYASVGGRVVLAGGWGLAELRADRWDTPFGPDMVAGLAIAVPIGSGWSVRGFFGRTDPDPLTLAQPGGGSGGVLVGRSLLATADEPAPSRSLYEVVRHGDDTNRVRVSVQAPNGTERVELLGDFTLWEPVAMQRRASRWTVEIDVPAGTHHFGFLVDDEWYVPDDAPDVVPDEWGRLSATLVIEGDTR